jgi:hypothetical protein
MMFSCFDDELFLILCEERRGVNDAGDIKGTCVHSKQDRSGGDDAILLEEHHFKTVLQEGV